MPELNPQGTNIILCDWRGTVKWNSGASVKGSLQEGDLAWSNISVAYQELAQQAFSRVVTLRERALLEMEDNKGRFFRVWMGPLDTPEMAVCVLSVAEPISLKKLSARERETVNRLARGMSAKEIAADLDVSLSTIHTHLRRVREKLELASTDALLAFAIRYCHPQVLPNEFQKLSRKKATGGC